MGVKNPNNPVLCCHQQISDAREHDVGARVVLTAIKERMLESLEASLQVQRH
jgi:hypothetical protein